MSPAAPDILAWSPPAVAAAAAALALVERPSAKRRWMRGEPRALRWYGIWLLFAIIGVVLSVGEALAWGVGRLLAR